MGRSVVNKIFNMTRGKKRTSLSPLNLLCLALFPVLTTGMLQDIGIPIGEECSK